jgi:succinoglycan biosynthesis protein ExoO
LDRFHVSYDTSLRNSEDYYLIAELLAQGARMLYLPEAGYRYTRSASSTSHRLKPEQTRAWLEAEARFMARYGAALSSGQQHALARRGRTLRHVDQLVAATDALKSRHVGEFVRLLASDLESSAYTLATFAKVASGKLLRRTAS